MKLEKFYPFHRFFIYLLIIITVFFIITRILIAIFTLPEIIEISKDVDFIILHRGFQNGLEDFYKPIEMPPGIPDWPPYYLYFWYFLFFPVGIIPPQIGVYIWDILRLLTVSLVILKASEKFKNAKDLFIFYCILTIGFSIDGWYNNVNFVILFFLFYSYHFLENNNKWVSGILFAVATFKINALLFIPVILIARKIKFKDLIYYLIPFGLICLPYLIFPDYFFQMLSNWFTSDTQIQGLTFLDSILWKFLQPSHLMFIGLLYIILFESLIESKRKNKIRLVVLLILLIYYVYLSIVVFIIPTFFN